MAIINGMWIPDAAQNMQPRADSRNVPQNNQIMPQLNFPSIAAPRAMPQSFPQLPMQAFQNPQMQAPQMMTMNNPNFPGMPNIPINPAMLGNMSQNPQGVSYVGALNNNPGAQAIANSMQGQGPMTQTQGNFYPVSPAGGDPTPLKAYNMMSKPTYGPSSTQAVNMSDPQARQNYLNSLQNKQLGAQNDWRNPAGIQGQGPQAGFVGFQQNGQNYQAPPPQQFNQPTGQSAQRIDYVPNAAGAQNPQSYAPINQSSLAQSIGSSGNMQMAGNKGYGVQQAAQKTFMNYSNNPSWMNNGNAPQQKLNFGMQPGIQPSAISNKPPHLSGSNISNQPNQISGSNISAGNPPQQKQNSSPLPWTPGGNKNSNSETQKTLGALGLSDVRSKQNIESGGKQLENFLDSLGVYSYEYKNPKHGDGRRISPMAQEIESTPLGKAAISTNEEGYKVVDYGKLGGTMLAALALLNNKYNKLEQDLKQSILKNVKNKTK